jgi:SAM-dependent methyltransferase
MFQFIKNVRHRLKGPEGKYAQVVLSDDEIKGQAYKKYLGGGEEKWETRGAFQLFFLKQMGLQSSHRFLDIGCGPIRGGMHVMRYLDAGLYHGIDYNKDFIEAARGLVAGDPLLAEKKPVLQADNDFGFSVMRGEFDHSLAFSVLNHCNDDQKSFFFRGLHRKLAVDGACYITHATWFKTALLAASHLKVTRQIAGPGEIAPDVRMDDWGWSAQESIFPIIELRRETSPRASINL